MPLASAIATTLAGSRVLIPENEPAPYRVRIYEFAEVPANEDPTFGIGDLVADLAYLKNIGYADYANDVPEAFFTLHQGDDQIADLGALLGKAHVRIMRGDRVVWAGWLMESDEQDDDVVFYAYGYVAGFYWALSDWDQQFASQEISNIVRDLWTRTHTDSQYSLLRFVATGEIEGAQNATDGAGEIVLPDYPLFYKRLLFAFQEIAALGMSDTSLNVVFEITHAENPAFNWWHDKGTRKADVTWHYGSEILSYQRRRLPVYRRNNVFVVGATPHNSVLRKEVSDSTDMEEWGRRQEPLFLSWVRDETELDRIAKLRAKHGKREDVDLTIRLRPNSTIPPGGRGAKWGIADSPRVVISHGITEIDDYFDIRGYRVIVTDSENVYVLLQEER